MGTKQTAEILNKDLGLPVYYDARLRERGFGSLEGKEWSSFDPDGSLHQKDDRQEYDYRSFGGESVEDVKHRLFASFKDIVQKEGGQPVLIVAHGGVIRLLQHLYGRDVERLIRNGSVHEFNLNI